jgi:hypothetical protein
MNLNTDHFTTPLYRNKTEKYEAYQERRIKQFNLNEVNQIYMSEFEKTVSPASYPTYKATIGNYLESLKNVDFATVDAWNIERYTEGRANAIAHIRSLMTYIVANNICDARDKVSKETLIWLIDSKAKKIA